MACGHDEKVVWAVRGRDREFSGEDGRRVYLPEGWEFVPSGDGGLTRRLKASGEYWSVVHRRKGRIERIGVCVPSGVLEFERKKLSEERQTEGYRHRLAQSRERRAIRQVRYEGEFYDAVLSFLGFPERWRSLGERLAKAVTSHAVPVGSGTVARTETLPLEVRAEAAVIAWMRHQTTCYDQMSIARVKGERRAVRRRLAERSREVLEGYRRGDEVDVARCPLWQGLLQWEGRAMASRSAEASASHGMSKPPVSSSACSACKGEKPNGHLSDFFLE